MSVAPFHHAADTLVPADAAAGGRLAAAVGRFRRSLWHAVEVYTAHASRAGRIRALEAQSDDELSALGIDRDGIVLHVFSDRLYL